MKIKCLKLIDKYSKEEMISDGWCTVGKIYDAVGLYFSIRESTGCFPRFEIAFAGDMENKPSKLSDLSCFEIIDNSLYENFGIYFDNVLNEITIEPKSWLEYKSPRDEYGSFWEDLFESERSAVELYRREVAFIKGEPYEPLPQEKPDAKELLEIYRRKERDGLISKQGFNQAFPPIPITSTDNWGQKKAL